VFLKFCCLFGQLFLPEIRHVSPKPTPNPVELPQAAIFDFGFYKQKQDQRSQPAAAPTRLCQQVCGVYLQFGARLV
jgi:hypothetical protein